MAFGNRYEIDQLLGEGAMGQVFAATDLLTRERIALKQVRMPENLFISDSFANSTEAQLALANEFQILAALRHPHIVSVLDYGFEMQGNIPQPFFTMRLLESPHTITAAAQGKPADTTLDYLIQLLLALDYLHRRDILHRDLKPANVLINDDHVYLVDFGLATYSSLLREHQISGTITHMSPEVLNGHAPSVQSDLFAFGLIATEVLTGQYPFDVTTAGGVLRDILGTEINFTALGLHADLIPILQQLTAKDAQQRPASAIETLRALCDAVGRPYPAETEALREAILQSATFIGREAELNTLKDATTTLVNEAIGGAWLIGGESGVGKSRLMRELRTFALVNGVLVLRGESVDNGGDYQLWHDAIRQVVLMVDVSDTEASILKPIIPDIETLLQRSVPDMPPAANDFQATVRATIVQLFGRLNVPTMLVLEDLQWANVRLLKQLLGIVDRHALLIVGTYRNDEAPQLEKDLGTMQHITLERLTNAETNALTHAMLGELPQQHQVLELIHRESDGNIFFVVEVVRALAERAGELDQIISKTLPSTVFAGGIADLIERRLQRVPASGRALLELAALLGRNLEHDILLEAMGAPDYDPQIPYEDWLNLCADAAIFSVEGNQWRFAHDKFREHILAHIDNKSELAAMTASAILQTAFGHEARFAPLLANLYQMANMPSEEYDHRLQAIDYLRDVYETDAILPHVLRAITLNREQGLPVAVQPLSRAVADVTSGGKMESAVTILDFIYPLMDDVNLRARAISQLARCHSALGNADARDHWLDEAANIQANITDPAAMIRFQRELMYVYHFMGDYEQVVERGQAVLELAETAHDEPMIALTCQGIGQGYYSLNELDQGLEYLERALAMYRKVDDLQGVGDTLSEIGVIHGRAGRTEISLEHYLEAYDLLSRTGQEHPLGILSINLGIAYKNLGDYEKAIESYNVGDRILEKYDTPYALVGTNLNRAVAQIHIDEFAAALASIQKATRIADDISITVYIYYALSVMAQLFVKAKKLHQAGPYVNWLLKADHQSAIHAQNEVKKLIDEHPDQLTDEFIATFDGATQGKTLDDFCTMIEAETITIWGSF